MTLGILLGALLVPTTKKSSSKVYKDSRDLEKNHIELLNALRTSTGTIRDTEVVGNIVKLEALTYKIFRHVKEYPEKQPQIRRFTEHYLPTALKMIQTYSTMEKQQISGENIEAARTAVNSTLISLALSFENLLDHLFKFDAIELSADMDVIESMLRQDGLMGESPFRTATM